MRKVVIINPFGIGDVLFSMPIVSVIKKNFPGSRIVYICNRRAFDLLKTNPDLDRIFIYEKDDFRRLWNTDKAGCAKRIWSLFGDLKSEGFDTAIDLSLGCRYSMYFQLMGVRTRIGFNYRERGRFLTKRLIIDGFSGKHVVEYYLDLMKLMGLAVAPGDNEVGIKLADEDVEWARRFAGENGVREGDTLVGIIPGCGASWGQDADYRRWDRANFAIVSDAIAERLGAVTVLLGSSGERGICDDIMKSVKIAPINACGKTTLGQFAALLKRCALVITNDGGPLHIARSLDVKTVSIFGPVDERVYGPYPPSERHVMVTCSTGCRPCYHNFKYVRCDAKRCLKGIEPERVIEAALGLMGRA